jgi:ribosomal protein S24E
MKVLKDNKNVLLKRREISVVVEGEKNPGFVEAGKIVGEQFKANEENIMVENVKGKFGRDTFLINASIYDTKELKDAAVKLFTKPKKAAPGAPAA